LICWPHAAASFQGKNRFAVDFFEVQLAVFVACYAHFFLNRSSMSMDSCFVIIFAIVYFSIGKSCSLK